MEVGARPTGLRACWRFPPWDDRRTRRRTKTPLPCGGLPWPSSLTPRPLLTAGIFGPRQGCARRTGILLALLLRDATNREPQMSLLPPDHPGRLALSNEVHARPPQPLDAPSSASYLAVLVDIAAREGELAHITTLCVHHGVNGPPECAAQFSASLGTMDFKWDRHGEFSTYAVFISGRSASPFQETASSRRPRVGWRRCCPASSMATSSSDRPSATARPLRTPTSGCMPTASCASLCSM